MTASSGANFLKKEKKEKQTVEEVGVGVVDDREVRRVCRV